MVRLIVRLFGKFSGEWNSKILNEFSHFLEKKAASSLNNKGSIFECVYMCRTKNDKMYFIVSVAYSIIVIVSHFILRAYPEWRMAGIAWNALFQIFGPTIGSLAIIVLMVVLWSQRKISGKVLLLSVVPLLIISVVCFYSSFMIMQGIWVGVIFMASVVNTNNAFGLCGFGFFFLCIVFLIRHFYYCYKYDMSLWEKHMEKGKELMLSPVSPYQYLGYRSVLNMYKKLWFRGYRACPIENQGQEIF